MEQRLVQEKDGKQEDTVWEGRGRAAGGDATRARRPQTRVSKWVTQRGQLSVKGNAPVKRTEGKGEINSRCLTWRLRLHSRCDVTESRKNWWWWQRVKCPCPSGPEFHSAPWMPRAASSVRPSEHSVGRGLLPPVFQASWSQRKKNAGHDSCSHFSLDMVFILFILVII